MASIKLDYRKVENTNGNKIKIGNSLWQSASDYLKNQLMGKRIMTIIEVILCT